MTSDEAEILASKHWGQAVEADFTDGTYEVAISPLATETETDVAPSLPRGTSKISYWEAMLALHALHPAQQALPKRDPFEDV